MSKFVSGNAKTQMTAQPESAALNPESLPAAEAEVTVKSISLAYKFLLLWFFFLGILFTLALITNVDWARPFVQKQVSRIIHRQVKIGHLAWNFGLNGLAIETNRLIVKDVDGSDFLRAPHAEMGVAFVPLLNKQLIIRHLSFNRPELWAVRTKKHSWNFDDLLEMDADIRFIQADHGVIHITDQADPSHPEWQPLAIEDANLQFVYPLKNKKTPLHLAFKLRRPLYTTAISFFGIGGGPNAWKSNKYQFEADADQLCLSDFVPFVRAVAEIEPHFELTKMETPQSSDDHSLASSLAKSSLSDKATYPAVGGLFNVRLKGEGIFDQGLAGKLNVVVKNFSLEAPQFGSVSAPEAASEAQVYVDREKISWHDLIFRVGKVELRSHGEIRNWKARGSDYNAHVAGHIAHLTDLKGLVDRKISTRRGELDVTPDAFGGAAEIDINANRTSAHTNIETDVDARGVMLKPFLKRNAAHLAPMMSLLGLEDNTLLTGRLKLIPNERLEIVAGNLPLAKGEVTTSGVIDLKDSIANLNFRAKSLHLAELRKSATGSTYISSDLRKVFSLSNKRKYAVGGVLDAQGVVHTSPRESKTSGAGQVRDFSINASDKSIEMSKVQGTFSWSGKKLKLDRLYGNIANGPFTLEGQTGLEQTPYLDWRMKADHLDLAQLGALMRLLQISVPIFSENHLYGTVQSLDLHIVGPRNKPKLSFTAVPENMYYQPPGLSRPLRATGGLIVYKNDDLVLNDVAFVGKGGQINTTMTIQSVTQAAKLTNLKIKTAGIDLSDVNFYLSSCLMPKPLKKIYVGFLKENRIFDVRGKTAANIECRFNGDSVSLNGSVKLDNVSAKVLQPTMPVEHISGTIATDGNDLIVQDFKGTFKQTVFDLQGKVVNYMDPNPVWRTKLTASLTPDEVLEMLPPLRDQLKKWQLDLHSKDNLDLVADYESNSSQSRITFQVKAEPGDCVSTETPFGTFYQPAGEDFLIDGVVISTKDNCELEQAHVHIGDSMLLVQGKLGTAFSSNGMSQKNALNPLNGHTVNITISTTKPVPAARLLSIIDPSLSKDQATGTVEGRLAIEGNAPDLRPSGKIVLKNICVPKLGIADLSGLIKMPEPGGQVASDLAAGQILLANLELPTFKWGTTIARKLHAKFVLDTSSDANRQAPVKISEGHAEVAGGSIDWNGTVNWPDRRMNVKGVVNGLNAAYISEQLFNRPGEVTGTIDGNFDLTTEGQTIKEQVVNLNGESNFTVRNGSIARFGQLQTGLTRLNLLHQGIFGFNLNNLLQSVVPVRTGKFKQITGLVNIEKGVVDIDNLKYIGDDMSLWAGGKANLKLGTLEVQVAGQIPRVSESFLGGPFSLSKDITLQRFVTVATLGRLKRLPSLPVLGDIGSDKPRTFQFRVVAPLDKPKMLSQSIERSFHWLPSRPTASAHPVLNID